MSNQKLILLVDDDPELVESNKLLLEAEGFAVQVAYD
ncbi:MAG: response regulator, partial [Lentisphaerae bacterium]|nr:response regulator [Lentisphaerota bacterium]